MVTHAGLNITLSLIWELWFKESTALLALSYHNNYYDTDLGLYIREWSFDVAKTFSLHMLSTNNV